MTLPDWLAGRRGVAIRGSHARSWSHADLAERCSDFASLLDMVDARGRAIGLLAGNSCDWIAADLAALSRQAALVPLPRFFTPGQLRHAVDATAMHALLCEDRCAAARLGFDAALGSAGALGLYAPAMPRHSRGTAYDLRGIQKVTFTSGTTGSPAGVCLTAGQQLETARALAAALSVLQIERHLNLLPLAVLLENVGGIYAPLMLGATCSCVPSDEVGLSGASAFDATRCLAAIAEHSAESIILLPQMLAEISALLEHDPSARAQIATLKFVAVGGAKTPVRVLRRARASGLPVYEGYGLSECASVVALNLPHADRIGTVGRPLPGTRVRIASDGEVEIAGRERDAPPGAAATSSPWLKTGDLGTIDEAGYLTIIGRKKSIFVTSYGRNVSPEWPESVLEESQTVAQAVVFGEGRPFPVAVIVGTAAAGDDTAIDTAIAEANTRLPDYARIGAWVRADHPFTSHNALATANGRVRRDAVLARYRERIDRLYEKGTTTP
jgi:long-subunit acyl-CoA synthetase (AMP-forming)